MQTDVTTEITAVAERDSALASADAALAGETRTRRSLQAAHQRLQLMSAATTRLSALLDPGRVVEELDLCVPQLADWLSIAETDDDGSVARVITRHRDADDHQESLRQVVRAFLGRPLPA